MKHIGVRRPKSVLSALYALRPYAVRLIIAGFLVFIGSVVLYMQLPKTIQYSWGAKNCVSQPTLLPKLQTSQSVDVSIVQEKLIIIFDYPVASMSTCFTVQTMAAGSQVLHIQKKPVLMPFLAQTYRISPEPYPEVLSRSVLPEPIPINGRIELLLNKPDAHFTYKLLIQDTYSTCSEYGVRITCDISNQGLVHATQYEATVMRELMADQASAANISFATVEPIQITSQSIAQGEKLVNKPTEFVVITNKTIANIDGVILRAGETSYPVEATAQDSAITIKLPSDLPRNATYTLSIASVTGIRNETLPAQYQTTFYLQPGPKVTGISIGDRGVAPSANIIVNFDQKLSPYTDLNIVTLKQEGAPVDANVSISGSSIKITPRQPLGKCAALSVAVNGRIENLYGVANTVAWNANSRVVCATSFSIGSSQEGRAVTAYSYGSGSREILYIGALHGDEGNTKRLLEKWMYELEGDPGRIPTGTTVVVIPLLNPDGYARESRYNARGVDLNRNFAANNWKSDIVVQGGQTVIKGGGESPLSEPESQAISNYIIRNKPEIVVSYHSKGGIVESNEAGNANQIGRTYASRSGYGYKEASSNIGFFNYDVNGSLEEWAKDKLGQPVILIELQTKSNDEFSKNKNAMWGLL